MTTERAIDNLSIKYRQEMAIAVRHCPAIRQRLIRVHGIVDYQLRIIKHVLVRGAEALEALPSPPDGRWPTECTLKNEDTWLTLPNSGAVPVRLWGASAVNCVSMVRKVFDAVQNLVTSAFFTQQENDFPVKLVPGFHQSKAGRVPRIFVDCDDQRSTYIICGESAGADEDHCIFIDEQDFPPDSLFLDLDFQSARVDVDNIPLDHVAKCGTLLDCVLPIAAKLQGHVPATVDDVALVRNSVRFLANYTVAASKQGRDPIWPDLRHAVDYCLHQIIVTISDAPKGLVHFLWDEMTTDGFPRYPESIGAWQFVFGRISAGTKSPQLAAGINGTPLVATSPSHNVEPTSHDRQRAEGYQGKDLCVRLGIGEQSLRTLRKKLGCKLSTKGVNILITPEEAFTVAAHQLEQSRPGTESHSKSLQFIQSSFPDRLGTLLSRT